MPLCPDQVQAAQAGHGVSAAAVLAELLPLLGQRRAPTPYDWQAVQEGRGAAAAKADALSLQGPT